MQFRSKLNNPRIINHDFFVLEKFHAVNESACLTVCGGGSCAGSCQFLQEASHGQCWSFQQQQIGACYQLCQVCSTCTLWTQSQHSSFEFCLQLFDSWGFNLLYLLNFMMDGVGLTLQGRAGEENGAVWYHYWRLSRPSCRRSMLSAVYEILLWMHLEAPIERGWNAGHTSETCTLIVC